MSFWEKYEKGIVFVAIYVDNNLTLGHPEAIDGSHRFLKQDEFILKVEDNLMDYLSCEIVFSTKRKKAWLGQPHLLVNLEKKFEKVVGHLRSNKTPGIR